MRITVKTELCNCPVLKFAHTVTLEYSGVSEGAYVVITEGVLLVQARRTSKGCTLKVVAAAMLNQQVLVSMTGLNCTISSFPEGKEVPRNIQS